tara:strand:- start:1136 stop:1882 length:747 start_codon:yes stop_codon:yes gene_type:complete
MSIIRAIVRLLCLLSVALVFIGIGFWLRTIYIRRPVLHKRHLSEFTCRWAKCICRILNIRVQIQGEARKSAGVLIVANHVGSPDIFVLGSCFNTFFLSMHDVADWPVVGTLARLGHTVFVDRSRKHQVKDNINNIADRLRNGFHVALFPEGQATDGSHVLPFKTSHFEAAVLAARPVLPVAIRYLDKNCPSIACWTGTAFAVHFIRLLTNSVLEVEVCILPEISSELGRRELALESYSAIRAELCRDN